MRMFTFLCTTASVVLLCCVHSEGASRRPAQRTASRFDCQERFERALRRFERRRYSEAAAQLEEIRFNCGGHGIIDSALYFLAMSYLQGKKPVEAQGVFERIVNNYPNSPFVPEARFRVAECVFGQSKDYSRDQSETRDAIVRYREFVQMHPHTPWADSAALRIDEAYDKLARKMFENARFYERIREYDAAAVYYRSLLSEYPRSHYVDDALVNLARALMERSRYSEAASVVEELLEESRPEEIRRRGEMLRQRLESRL